MVEAGPAAALAVAAAAYGVGTRRAWRKVGPGRLVGRAQVGLFSAALVAMAAVLLPPVAPRAESGLVAHMDQHVVLLVVAAPLLALGAPLPAMLWALPERARRPASALWRGVRRNHRRHWPTWAGASLVVSAAVMAGWHAPGPYQAALADRSLHAAEHVTMVLTATGFWWAVGLGAPRPKGASVAVVFLAALPGTALGAALTLAQRPWYRAYPSLADQQLAGVVMWGFAGLAYVLAAAALFGVWLRGLELDAPGRPLAAAER